MLSNSEVLIPSTITVDMAESGEAYAKRSLFYHEGLASALPGLPEAFARVDSHYLGDRESYLSSLEESLFSVKIRGWQIPCSLRYSSASSTSSDINITSHGFSDYPPKSSTAQLLEYIGISNPTVMDKQRGLPNTWSPITKAASLHDVREEFGLPMPQLDIYRPVHARYSHGDFSSFKNIVLGALKHAQQEIHGKTSETQITGLHLEGISLGASEIIGSGAEIMRNSDSLDIKSVTAHELIMGLSLPELIKFSGLVGESSANSDLIGNTPAIHEPLMRQEIDRHGNEKTLAVRMLGAIIKMAVHLGNGLPKFEKTKTDFVYLSERSVPITVALAENSYASSKTKEHLPGNTSIITIEAAHGQRIGHIINEHVASLVAVSLLGINRSLTQSLSD